MRGEIGMRSFRFGIIWWIGVVVVGWVGVDDARGQGVDHGWVCTGRMKRVALGILMYMQDNDLRMPPMSPQSRLEKAVNPYLERQLQELRGHKLSGLWRCSESGLPFAPNKALSNPGKRISLMDIDWPEKTVLLGDPRAHKDKKWRVVFVDGHVRPYRKLPRETLVFRRRRQN